ncbi:MAG: RDD family protein, partial [Bifidobacteriaceae bacterium]|nr:RDD family protein [Bifidobacteriaceae bacterium]
AGIRVVRDDGGPVALRQAFVRALSAVFEVWLILGGIAFVTMLFNDRGKRVGDFLAGTYVMRVRGVQLQVLSLSMPPELAAWARIADIGTLGDGLALRARQFLLRAHSLSLYSRQHLGVSLAAEVAQRTAPPPPPGTHPERYLAAVICERRNRELALAPRRIGRAEALTSAVRHLPYQIPDPAN